MTMQKKDSIIDKGKSQLGFGSDNSAALTKLKIGETYSVFLNPNQIAHSIKVNFIQQDHLSITTKNELNKIVPISVKPESLSFTLTLDGTGSTGSLTNVPEEILNLMNATYHPLLRSGETQTELKIEWGSTINFKGYLESFEVVYTLFKSSGEPLRAIVSLSFLGKSSLTKAEGSIHRNTAKELELDSTKTIVNLCNSFYNTSGLHIALAKANKLTTIRKLESGKKIYFPPYKN